MFYLKNERGNPAKTFSEHGFFYGDYSIDFVIPRKPNKTLENHWF